MTDHPKPRLSLVASNAAPRERPRSGDTQGALVYFKQDALRSRRRVHELEAELQAEKAARKRDTTILYRAAQVYADANGATLSTVGASPFERALRLAHGGTLSDFSAWYVETGKYVDG